MEVSALRKELHDFINRTDERFLKMIFAMSKEYEKPTVIGYSVDGSPITQLDLKKRVKAASRRVKAGNYLTQEEIDQEVKSW